jgi:hypothetical protein
MLLGRGMDGFRLQLAHIRGNDGLLARARRYCLKISRIRNQRVADFGMLLVERCEGRMLPQKGWIINHLWPVRNRPRYLGMGRRKVIPDLIMGSIDIIIARWLKHDRRVSAIYRGGIASDYWKRICIAHRTQR